MFPISLFIKTFQWFGQPLMTVADSVTSLRAVELYHAVSLLLSFSFLLVTVGSYGLGTCFPSFNPQYFFESVK